MRAHGGKRAVFTEGGRDEDDGSSTSDSESDSENGSSESDSSSTSDSDSGSDSGSESGSSTSGSSTSGRSGSLNQKPNQNEGGGDGQSLAENTQPLAGGEERADGSGAWMAAVLKLGARRTDDGRKPGNKNPVKRRGAANEGPAVAGLTPPPHRWIHDAEAVSADSIRCLSVGLAMARHTALASDSGGRGSGGRGTAVEYERSVLEINEALALNEELVRAVWAAARVRRPVAAAALAVQEYEKDIHNAEKAKRNTRGKVAEARADLFEARKELERVGAAAVNTFFDADNINGRLFDALERRLASRNSRGAEAAAAAAAADGGTGADGGAGADGGTGADGGAVPEAAEEPSGGRPLPESTVDGGWYHGGHDPIEWYM